MKMLNEQETQKRLELNKKVRELNDSVANETSRLLSEKGVFCINIMGSPGAGKTTFIELVSRQINPKQIAVIQGDLESDVDKKRLEKLGIDSHQINTHTGCHLNAEMVKLAVDSMEFGGKKFLFIENVGNLVCPANKKIGQHLNVVISSTTEGSDKPKKYPIIFRDAELIVISKYDLAGHVDFDEPSYISDLKNINAKAEIVKISKNMPSGFDFAGFFGEIRNK